MCFCPNQMDNTRNPEEKKMQKVYKYTETELYAPRGEHVTEEMKREIKFT